MSVQTLSFNALTYLREALIKSAHCATVNESYCPYISAHLKDENILEESKRLVMSWSDLNERSYNVRYKEKSDVMLSGFITFRESHPKITALQTIKYINFLVYNINGDITMTEQEQKDYELLKKIETSLQWSYINSIKEYQNAKWSE
jgi:hypothetical protein